LKGLNTDNQTTKISKTILHLKNKTNFEFNITKSYENINILAVYLIKLIQKQGN